MNKKCSNCKEIKDLSLFYSNTKSMDGYASWCKGCTNGGSTKEPGFGGNREKAIQRDGEKCVLCGMTRKEHRSKYGRDITVDHINGKGRNTPKEKRDNRLENLQTLCLRCHGLKDIARSNKTDIFGKRTVQMDLSGNVIKVWESIIEVERVMGLSSKSLNKALNRPNNIYGGFRWEYLNPKVPHQIKTIQVEEWFSEEKTGVYRWFRFENGDVVKLLTPYEKSPIVIWKPMEGLVYENNR